MRLTQRRKLVTIARAHSEEAMSIVILAAFKKQRRILDRFLRKANLRKRMNKISWAVEMGEVGAYRAQELLKEDFGPKEWQEWKKLLVSIILAALIPLALDMIDIENDLWSSSGYPTYNITPDELVASYEEYSGSSIGEVATTTMRGVEAELAAWYMTNESFSQLMSRMDKWFDGNRARLAAEIASGNMVGYSVMKFMINHGWAYWFWDAQGEDPCSVTMTVDGQSYNGCRDLHGKRFSLGVQMPPQGSHIRCKCLPTPDINN